MRGGHTPTQQKHVAEAIELPWIYGFRETQQKMVEASELSNFDTTKFLEDEDDDVAMLNAALEDGDPAEIRLALKIIARTRGMSKVAKEANVLRESLYRALSEKGNPEFARIIRVIQALGFSLSAHRVERR